MNLTMVLEIVDRVLRSWWTLVAGACLGLAGGFVAVDHLPKIYQANTTIFVTPPQIPEEYVRSTVTDDMAARLIAIKEAVLSRPYMEAIVLKHYGTPSTPEDLERKVGSVRGRVDVDTPRIDRRRGERGGVFRVKFRDTDPVRAADIANELADRYIEENVRFRTTQAEGTAEMLEELAATAQEELRQLEERVAAFKAAHLYETQEHWDANLQFLAGAQSRLEVNTRNLEDREEERDTLIAQRAQASLDAGLVPGIDPATARLNRVRQEYEDLRSKYHDDHPDVRSKKRELEELEAAARRRVAEGGEGGSFPAGMTPLDVKIDAAEREIARLESENERIEKDIAEYQRRLSKTPLIEQQLAELTKPLEAKEEQYQEYRRKAEDAKGSQRVEESEKGERFQIIEEARPPAIPISPNPPFILAIGLAAGLALFVGPIVLRAVLLPVVGSEAGLKDALEEVPVLISIPRVRTEAVVHARRRRVMANFAAATVAVALLVLVRVFVVQG